MSWQLLIAISILAQAATTLLQRVLLKDNRYSPVAYAIFVQWIVVVIMFVAALIFGFDTDFSKLSIPTLILVPLIYTVAVAARFISLSKTEASEFAVLFNTRAIWTVFIGILILGESLESVEVVGIGLIVFASLLATYEGKRIELHKGQILALVSATAVGIGLGMDAFNLSDGFGVLTYAAISFFATSVILTIIYRDKLHEIKPIAKNNGYMSKTMVVAVLYAVVPIALLLAYREGDIISVLAPLTQMQTILIVLGGIVLLRERKRIPQKLAATAISVVGILLVI